MFAGSRRLHEPASWLVRQTLSRGARRTGVVLLAVVALALWAAPGQGWAAAAPQTPLGEVYVDRTVPGCSDTGAGTQDVPFCSITSAVPHLQAGYTLYIGNGSYAETIKPAVSGTSAAPVTITAWPGRSPVIGNGASYGAYVSAKSYLTISDLTFTATVHDGIYVSKSDHITVSGNTVTDAGTPAKGATAPGISLRATSASVADDNDTNHNSDSGILVASGSTGNTVSDNRSSFNAQGWQRNANGINITSPGNTIIRNVTHDNEDSGIQFYTGGDNNLATLNVTYGNGDHGIDDLNVTGGTLVGNTVFHNCTTGINVEGTGSSNYTVANNVSVDNAVYPAYGGISCSRRAGNIGLWDGAQNSSRVDHNLVYLTKSGVMYAWGTTYTSLAAMQKVSGQEAAGIQADPMFVDPSGGNLQLSEGSPAVDRADSGVPGEQSSDVLGHARVRDPNVDNGFAAGPRLYDDLGAYELQPGAPPPQVLPPTAALTLTPSSGTAPVTVTADASASTDPQVQTLSYTFDFGDGSAPTSQSGPTTTHTYPNPGTYTVTLTARNTSGLTGVATQTATVDAAPASQPPKAALTVTPTEGVAPLKVSADASASTDPQGQSLSYAFDFGDGSVQVASSTATAAHTYQAAGTYVAKVTVTNASGLTDTSSVTVTADAAPPAANAPTAALTVTPSSGTAPVTVSADASASTDPQGQALTYAFDFGDGTTLPAQQGPTASHTYGSGGAYTVTVTVTNTSGLSDSTVQTLSVTDPQPPATAPAYVNQIATNYSTSSGKTSASLTVWRTGGVSAGDLVVITLQLVGTDPTATVSASDGSGNGYTVASDASNDTGGRLVVLFGVAATALPDGARITARFPSSNGYRILGDEFAGASRVDQTAAAGGTTATFDSGPTGATAGSGVAFGAVALYGGTGAPAWATGWKGAGTYQTGSDYLGRAYQLPTAGGSFDANGQGSGSWLAATVTFLP